MKPIKLPISVSHSKNFGINNINNGHCVFEGYQSVGLLEGIIKGDITNTATETNTKVIKKFYNNKDFFIGAMSDTEVKVLDKDLGAVDTFTYTEIGDINKVSELKKSILNTTDTDNTLYNGTVDNTDDYIGFESVNYIMVDTSNGKMTPGAYVDKVLTIDGQTAEYAITGNTFNKIFIQDIFDVDINGGDTFKVYDTKEITSYIGNFAIQPNDYKYVIGPFKNRLIGYSPTTGKLVYSYIGLTTTDINKYNIIHIGTNYNGLKVLNINGQEKLFLFGNGEVKILDMIGDVLGIIGTYPINNNILDIIVYEGNVLLLANNGLFTLGGKKLNKLFDFLATEDSCLGVEDKYLTINNINSNGNTATILLNGLERVSILKGINSLVIYENNVYTQVGDNITQYTFEENGYTSTKNNQNIIIEFNPIYSIDDFNNIQLLVDNISGKSKQFFVDNITVQIKTFDGDWITLNESDYNYYNGYFNLNYDYNGLKNQINGILLLKITSNIPLFGIYLTTTK